MRILMKYLVIKLFVLSYVFISESIYASDFDCAQFWYTENILQINNEIISIEASTTINNDSLRVIDLFIDTDNNRFRIDYNNQIFILDENKSIKVFKNTNQLYIDNPDTALHNIIFSIFSGNFFENNYVEVLENKYLIKNYLNFNQIELVYNNECIYIEYINLESDKMDIHINEIDFKVINDNDLFNLNEEYFKYDLRHED